MKMIGILSDTHCSSISPSFLKDVNRAFGNCDTIIHAGDLVSSSILQAFGDREIFAVHGNMCDYLTSSTLPESRTFSLGGYLFALCHGTGQRHNIEERMYERFAEADCIIFGHTHIPVCTTIGDTLLFNPGSFTGTGRHGSPGTYGLLTIDETGLHGSIHHL